MALAIALTATSCGGDSDPEIVDNDNPATNVPTTINGHKFVDLGLPSGTLWAETNIGASTPYEDGDYFAWGETKSKSSYTESNYKYWGSKYNSADGKTSLSASDDAATAKWGDGCRIPSTTELKELKSKCSWSWKSNYNGASGYLVTGPNGNSIFLPAAGLRDEEELEFHGTEGNYWSCQPNSDDKYYAQLLSFGRNDMDIFSSDRYLGFSIRPVTTKDNNGNSDDDSSQGGQESPNDEPTTITTINGHKFVDLGLPSGTLWAETNIGATSAIDYGDYFAWGETQIKKEYSFGTYQFSAGATPAGMKKYNTTDGLVTLQTSDDAATANWGVPCRIPTADEFDELLPFSNNCTWIWTSQTSSDGTSINGIRITSKKNGNSIFLPASGLCNGNSLHMNGTFGRYWSSTLWADYCTKSFAYEFSDNYFSSWSENRSLGYSIRPVVRKKE